MPWKECHVMDERLRFIGRLLDGEKMAPVCAEFGISRKTGYKIYHRYSGSPPRTRAAPGVWPVKFLDPSPPRRFRVVIRFPGYHNARLQPRHITGPQAPSAATLCQPAANGLAHLANFPGAGPATPWFLRSLVSLPTWLS